MKALKDIKVLAAAALVLLGLAFEGLRQIKLAGDQEASQSLGKAGELFSIYKDSTLPVRKVQPQVQTPKNKIPQIPTVASANTKGIAFDLQKAIGEYQREHGLDPATLKKKKEDEKKNKKKAQYEYVWDAKTGQWIKRKKLTEAQKKMLADRRAKRSEQDSLAKKLSDKNKDAIKDGMFAAPTQYAPAAMGPAATTAVDSKESKFMSFEEWASILLQHPNRTEMQKFVEAFRSQKVTTDIYFQIMNAMMNDPRIEMQELGIDLASYNPSANSFKALAYFLKDQSFNGAANAAQKRLDQYASIQHLSLLEKIMKQGDDYLIVTATKRLELAIQKYLVTPEEPTSSHVTSLTRFVDVLKQLSQSSSDAKVIAQAQATLAQLQNSLGKYNVAANGVDSPR